MTHRVLHIDGSAGASGDMLLGALVDLGVPIKKLREELGKLGVEGFRLVRSRSSRGGIAGVRIRVAAPGDRGYRHLSDFERVIRKCRLGKSVKERGLSLLRRLFEAEAEVHGKTPESIHLHELGSLDTLVDVMGTIVGVEHLDVDDVTASPINVGGGSVETEHGRMAVPAPATTLLLKGAPVFSDGDFERTTPTGALLVTGLARRFTPWPTMTLLGVGYGLGTKDPETGRPNALRLALGSRARRRSERAVVLETTVDDMTPEQVGYLTERLWERGVLDVFVTPVQMKKNRPGFNVTVLAHAAVRDELAALLFAESTTLGVRSFEVERDVLERRSVRVKTPYGTVRVKEGLRDGKVVTRAPEFEDCRKVAAARGVALKRVQQAALGREAKKVGEE